MTEFTPGPWEKKDYWKHGHPTIACGDGYGIALVLYDDDSEANAHLIAAAPELYESLEAALSQLDSYACGDVIAAAEKALAKARGEHDG